MQLCPAQSSRVAPQREELRGTMPSSFDVGCFLKPVPLLHLATEVPLVQGAPQNELRSSLQIGQFEPVSQKSGRNGFDVNQLAQVIQTRLQDPVVVECKFRQRAKGPPGERGGIRSRDRVKVPCVNAGQVSE